MNRNSMIDPCCIGSFDTDEYTLGYTLCQKKTIGNFQSTMGEKFIELCSDLLPELIKYCEKNNFSDNYHINELYNILFECADHANQSPFFKKDSIIDKEKIFSNINSLMNLYERRSTIIDQCIKFENICKVFLNNTYPLSMKNTKQSQNIVYDNRFGKLCDSLIQKTETIKFDDIAHIINESYKDRFVCINIQRNQWYEFKNHKWVYNGSLNALDELISNDMPREFNDTWKKIIPNTSSKIIIDNYRKIINKLGDKNFKRNLIRCCTNKFYDAEFESRLDTDVNLLGFENGIMDLKKMCFRDGLPSDHVSYSVGYKWIHFNENDPKFDEIYKSLSQIQTNDTNLINILKFIAYVFSGISDEKLHVWEGKGNDGKSIMICLIKKMLGDYFDIIPSTILTKRYSGAIEPELAKSGKKRCLVILEGEGDMIYLEKIESLFNHGIMKPLHSDLFFHAPQYNVIMQCNQMPRISGDKKKIAKTVEIVPFESEFVVMNPMGPKQFIKNVKLFEEIDDWVQPLMWLIITKYYPMCKKRHE